LAIASARLPEPVARTLSLNGSRLKVSPIASASAYVGSNSIARLIQIETLASLRQRRRFCRSLIRLSPMKRQWAVPMDAFIDEVVRRSIRHARLMLKQGSYNWPVARIALRKILADLEEKTPDHPSLQRLRAFIVSSDRAWLDESP
jgi:hypothetical protein